MPSGVASCAGANLDVDVPWKYLNFFLEDDMRLREIGREYGAGRMLTGEVKKELIGVRSGARPGRVLHMSSVEVRGCVCFCWRTSMLAGVRQNAILGYARIGVYISRGGLHNRAPAHKTSFVQ